MKYIVRILVLLVLGMAGWALGEAAYYFSNDLLTHHLALVVNFIAFPVIFMLVSYVYFKYFNFTRPAITALFFCLIALFLDVVIAALFIEHSFKMFENFFGTWMPLLFIFLSVYLTGFNFTDKSLGR